MFAGFLIFNPDDKKVPTPATYKLVAVINPTVAIPEILNADPTILLDKVIVAIPAAPVVPVTENPVPKVN